LSLNPPEVLDPQLQIDKCSKHFREKCRVRMEKRRTYFFRVITLSFPYWRL